MTGPHAHPTHAQIETKGEKANVNEICLSERHYCHETTIHTNISSEYVDVSSTQWTEWEMIRECMQNMMDECDYLAQTRGGHLSDYLHIEQITRHESRWWCLSDEGRGADVANILYLGLSGKRGQGYRGEKGEGQLLAFLVAARKSIGIVFASQDYLLIPGISEENGHPHLALDLYRTQEPIQGTRILIEGTLPIDVYMRDRYKLFPDIVKPKDLTTALSRKKIFEPDEEGAKLYHKGIFVRPIKALFSYNLSESRISRDRDVVSESDLIAEIGQIWSEVTNLTYIARLIDVATSQYSSSLEMRIQHYTLSERQQVIWRKAFRDLAGHRRAVLWTDDIVTREARRKEYVVLKILQQPVFDALFEAGIERDCDVAQAPEPYQELSPSKNERALFAIFDDVAEKCAWEDGRTFKVFAPTGTDASYDKRLAFQLGSILYFNRSYLTHSTFGELLQTFVHEETHRQFGAPDESREFEQGQARLWLDIVKYASRCVIHHLVTWNAQQAPLTQEAT